MLCVSAECPSMIGCLDVSFRKHVSAENARRA